jgi:hypothetical protein
MEPRGSTSSASTISPQRALLAIFDSSGYLRGQLRLSWPRKPHTLHFPAFGETSHDLLSWPGSPHIEQVRVPVELISASA